MVFCQDGVKHKEYLLLGELLDVLQHLDVLGVLVGGAVGGHLQEAWIKSDKSHSVVRIAYLVCKLLCDSPLVEHVHEEVVQVSI